MRIAIVGCGYVADMYAALLAEHPQLELAGVFDRVPERARRLASTARTRDYGSLAALLDDASVALVVNLTNPRSHFEVSRACLLAGKHVYSEKPLATVWAQAVELVDLAEQRGLQIASAPCTVLGESAQTAWKALRAGAVGQPLLAYAEIDDGMVHLENLASWVSASGSPWPFQDEFEVGCTLEHAGYYATWLVAMFGPAKSVTSFASCRIRDKRTGIALDPPDTPDFTVGCLEFESGVVARLTCSIVAPHDHGLRIFGTTGTLAVRECWDFGSRVTLQRRNKWTFRAEKRPLLARLLGLLGFVGLGPRRVPLVRHPRFRSRMPGGTRIDFCRGVAELADAIAERRPCRLSARFSLHVNEIVLALQDPAGMGCPRQLVSGTFPAMQPMPWATDGAP